MHFACCGRGRPLMRRASVYATSADCCGRPRRRIRHAKNERGFDLRRPDSSRLATNWLHFAASNRRNSSRGERIRTSDLLVPNQTRYQAALRPAMLPASYRGVAIPVKPDGNCRSRQLQVSGESAANRQMIRMRVSSATHSTWQSRLHVVGVGFGRMCQVRCGNAKSASPVRLPYDGGMVESLESAGRRGASSALISCCA
jgi:hypothetical protein